MHHFTTRALGINYRVTIQTQSWTCIIDHVQLRGHILEIQVLDNMLHIPTGSTLPLYPFTQLHLNYSICTQVWFTIDSKWLNNYPIIPLLSLQINDLTKALFFTSCTKYVTKYMTLHNFCVQNCICLQDNKVMTSYIFTYLTTTFIFL